MDLSSEVDNQKAASIWAMTGMFVELWTSLRARRGFHYEVVLDFSNWTILDLVNRLVTKAEMCHGDLE